MSDTETFTELDVDERRELLEQVRDVGLGETVRLTWDSRRSDDYVSVVGVTGTYPGEEDVALYVKTNERKGRIYVKVREGHMENVYHSPIVAYSTGGTFSRRQPRLGELIDVKVLEAGGDA